MRANKIYLFLKPERKLSSKSKIITCVIINLKDLRFVSFPVKYQYEVEKWLNTVDYDLSQFNSLAAHLTWKLSTVPNEKTSKQARQLGKVRNRWKNKVCQSNIKGDLLTPEQSRKLYLLCRGPKFTDEMAM